MEKSINLEAKEIAAGVELDDRIEYIAKAPAYITLKDYKDFAHAKAKSERSAN